MFDLSKILSTHVEIPKPTITGVAIKYVGGYDPVNIQTAPTAVLEEMCQSERNINVNFQVMLPGGRKNRHVSLSYFKATEFSKITYEERLALVIELREIDISQFTLTVVGATAFGKVGEKFVVLACHLGKHQQWFTETRFRGDKEWFGPNPICHISTCWGYDEDTQTFKLRGEDTFTDEHAWILALIINVGSFLVAEDQVLIDRFNQLSATPC